jgi:6-phosphogluconolactonase/glucosamine-6-phosphate isomerase/deaminase
MAIELLSGDIETASQLLFSALRSHLANNERVLWLLSGGSAIDVAVRVSQLLPIDYQENLYVMLMDERYGTVGHADSNWKGMQAAGFDFAKVTAMPTLDGYDAERTRDLFEQHFTELMKACQYHVGLFGIGADGHTAGILPHSEASASHEVVAMYSAGPFQRITLTADALKRLDEAFVYAIGKDKWPVMAQILNEDKPFDDQPAQLLKVLPKMTLFTDYKGEIA